MNDETYLIYLIAKWQFTTYAALWAATFAAGFLAGIGFLAALLIREKQLDIVARKELHEYLRDREVETDNNPFLGIRPPKKPDWYSYPGPKRWGAARWADILHLRKQFVSRETSPEVRAKHLIPCPTCNELPRFVQYGDSEDDVMPYPVHDLQRHMNFGLGTMGIPTP